MCVRIQLQDRVESSRTRDVKWMLAGEEYANIPAMMVPVPQAANQSAMDIMEDSVHTICIHGNRPAHALEIKENANYNKIFME